MDTIWGGQQNKREPRKVSIYILTLLSLAWAIHCAKPQQWGSHSSFCSKPWAPILSGSLLRSINMVVISSGCFSMWRLQSFRWLSEEERVTAELSAGARAGGGSHHCCNPWYSLASSSLIMQLFMVQCVCTQAFKENFPFFCNVIIVSYNKQKKTKYVMDMLLCFRIWTPL